MPTEQLRLWRKPQRARLVFSVFITEPPNDSLTRWRKCKLPEPVSWRSAIRQVPQESERVEFESSVAISLQRDLSIGRLGSQLYQH